LKGKKCPRCSALMVRKGSFKRKYWKCPDCGTVVTATGEVRTKGSDLSLRYAAKEESRRKFIRKLKKNKYCPLEEVEWDGEIIFLSDYDKNGDPIDKEMEKERK